MEPVRRSDGTLATTSADSAVIFIVNSLLIPILPVLTLLACVAVSGVRFGGRYFLIAVLTFLLASDFFGPLQLCAPRFLSRMLLDICMRWGLLVTLIGMLIYLSGLADALDYRLLAVWAGTAPIVLWIGQWSAHRLLRASLKAEGSRHAVIVGASELGQQLEKQLREDPFAGVEVVGYFDDRAQSRLGRVKAEAILGPTRDLAEYVAHHEISHVFITLPISRAPRIVSIIDALRNSTASIYFVPDLLAFDSIQARFDTVNGIPVLAICETPFYGMARVMKRLSDIVVASLALLVTLPVFIAIAIGIRLDSPGPVFFRQKRYGLNGREILVCKFRTMTVAEDGNSVFKAAERGDARITRFGARLRRTSLDELPQLLNVLEGSMSIVGPRPHASLMNEQYRGLIPRYMVRHKVKPGITGWAQVNGARGGDDIDSMRKRLQFDLEYLRDWSLWFDLKILARTTTVVWTHRDAY
ncbi:MAG: undecaprenyl-phosphate glucose phosphotransferase [Gammaproteobacteria bacterium]